jgi:prepilin-type N-terminal cleavage/methylation domain-containing protein
MNNSTYPPHPRRTAFTLIELLVVIAVIGVLASLIFPITGVLKKKRMVTVAQAELAQIETAIDAYKAKYGTYPPDNPGNPLINPLYFELEGTTNNGSGYYQTLDGSGQISSAAGQFTSLYGAGVTGFVNTSASAKGSDDKGAAVPFLKDVRPNQVGKWTLGAQTINAILVCSVQWDNVSTQPLASPPAAQNGLNPWRYDSSHPVNNPGSYDLWVDFLIKGKTNRVSNWSKQVQVQ